MPEKPEINTILEGKVVKVKPFGAIVRLPDNSQGLVHISHISNRYVQDINDFLSVGDEVNVKVLSVDGDGEKISLSIKDAEQKEDFERNHEPEKFKGYEPVEAATFEDKFKEWVKSSNERHAGINKRNKRR